MEEKMAECIKMAPPEAETSVPAQGELDVCGKNTPIVICDPAELSPDLRAEVPPTEDVGSVSVEQPSDILIKSIERSASEEHRKLVTQQYLETIPETEHCIAPQQEQTPASNLTSSIVQQTSTTAEQQRPPFLNPYYTSNLQSKSLLGMPAEIHPLRCSWTMWYLEQERHKCWEDQQHEISNVNTVEDFWRLYMSTCPPSQLKYGCDYSLFRHGIRPMWEDAGNKEGGRWKMAFHGNNKFDLDAVWLDVCLILIGESLEHPEKTCGAVVNVRGKINKIAVWTAKEQNWGALLRMGHQLRQTLRLQQGTLRYELHKDSMGKQGSNIIEAIYTV